MHKCLEPICLCMVNKQIVIVARYYSYTHRRIVCRALWYVCNALWSDHSAGNTVSPSGHVLYNMNVICLHEFMLNKFTVVDQLGHTNMELCMVCVLRNDLKLLACFKVYCIALKVT